MKEGIQQALRCNPIELMVRLQKYKEIEENYTDTENRNLSKKDKYIFGLSIGLFILILIIASIPFFIAIYLLVKYSSAMPTWAKVMAWIFTLMPVPGGSIIAIILVYTTKKP